MAAFVELIVVDKFWKRPLCPTARGLIDPVWKGADGDRNGDVPDVEKATLILAIEPSRRDRRVCQPIECYVVGDVISR